jgi:type I restriction enzyme S subunit
LIGPFGSAFDTENYVENGDYRYVRGQDVKPFILKDGENRYVPFEDFERLKKYALKEKDILVSVVGTLGNACIVQNKDLPAIFSCKSTVIRTTAINPVYVLTFLNCKYGRELLIRKERGAIQKGLNLDDLKTSIIPSFSDSFQLEIEHLFYNAQSKIAEGKSQYSSAETLLLETLGLKDFEPSTDAVNVKGFKDSFLATARLDAEYYQKKYEEIERIISENGVYRIKDVFALLSNPSPSSYTESGIKVIKTKNVRIPSVEIENITDHTTEKCLLVQQNDLLFASMGVGSLGRLSYCESDIKNCTVDGTIKVFRCKKEFQDEYLEIPTLLFLTSSFGQELIYKYVIGSTGIISISKENIENLLVPIIDKSVAVTLTSMVLESQQLKKQSEQLLETAKRAVELAIEQDEEAGMRYIEEAGI